MLAAEHTALHKALASGRDIGALILPRESKRMNILVCRVPLLLMVALAGFGPLQGAKPMALGAVIEPGVSTASAADCAILTVVAKSELVNEGDQIRFPALPEVSPRSSLAERHAAYLKRMNEAYAGTAMMKDVQSLEQWVQREETELRDFYPSLAKEERTAIVKQRSLATSGFQANCNWAETSSTIKIPVVAEQSFQPWLVFGRPYILRKGRLAFVDISFAYSPTFAREGQCAVEHDGEEWRVAKCHYGLMS